MVILMSLFNYILISFLIFGIIIILLVIGLLFAKSKLTPKGTVKININGEKEIITEPGNSLLMTLSNNSIYLPSACGGSGTCGLCKVQVLNGGGSILPTEVGFFNRRQILDKWRLGCQVKVKEDLEIKVPESVLGVKQWECEVVSNKNVATFIKELILKLPNGEILNFNSGEYIQIYVPENLNIDFSKDIYVEEEFRDEWDKLGVWNLKLVNKESTFRAYSMANYPAENDIVMLNVRIATPPWDKKKNKFMDVPPGICSSYIFSLKPGDKVKISGPYGEFHLKDTNKEMIFIGGGAGMAPMRSHIFHLFKTLHTKRKVSFWYGGRSLRELFYVDQYRQLETENPNFKFVVALSEPKPEDNWNGSVGFIHQVLYENYLKNHPEPEDCEYYICGPPAMLNAVLNLLDSLGVPPENIAFDDFGS
ncbi:MAG TPA: NADH:ubiquinone reductase (Na(+)-transporting) subunit F [Bacteroidales bacterium]|nr:NADH:ubiquinone reductase (Na(+)-transporting) subunit F [Bacteroidales bacterium]HQJ59013.1 NADH:ubiquinone reductase (Na(+)-transporting) subunit F [Bacteroidales bacterium]